MTTPTERSYRALLGVPFLARTILGMQLVRVAENMIGVTLVLLALTEYHSPELAGLATLAATGPGLLTSPITGALLDRHGRIRLIQVDFVLAGVAFALIGGLAIGHSLPAWLLLLIAGISSFTAPLGNTGLRTLFPLMAPRHLWEPLNAIDSMGFVVATILGPPVAAILVVVVGAPATLIVTAVMFAVAILIIRGVPEPPTTTVSSGRILVDAWQGVRHAWSNRTIRGLGLSITMASVANGTVTIVVPLIVLRALGLPETMVGLVFAAQGVAGAITGLLAGRIDTRGRERRMIILPMIGTAGAIALLGLPGGLPVVILAMLCIGALVGPLDVAMFSLRQRRTDPAWMGRAFAISMSLNFAGYPIGSAIAGFLGARSVADAVALGVGAMLVASVLAWRLIPARDTEFTLDAAGATVAIPPD